MRRIDVKFILDGILSETTFRTNDSGEYLFVGVSENKQINCDGGFQNLSRMKKEIRNFLSVKYGDRLTGKIKYDSKWF